MVIQTLPNQRLARQNRNWLDFDRVYAVDAGICGQQVCFGVCFCLANLTSCFSIVFLLKAQKQNPKNKTKNQQTTKNKIYVLLLKIEILEIHSFKTKNNCFLDKKLKILSVKCILLG